MVRTIKPPHHQNHEEEYEDAEDVAAGTDTSSHREGKSAEQKPNNYRSKHSETEQRRRSKINERFQILRDLIPPNDQKRDKASLLLEVHFSFTCFCYLLTTVEVIEYIQYLQEKVQVYEGSYQQVWSHEPTKLTPWRANHGLVDNFVNHSQAMKNGFLDENTAVQPMPSMQGSVESELSGEFPYRADHAVRPVNPVIPLSISLPSSAYPPGRGIQLIENLAFQPHGSVDGAIIGTEDRPLKRGSSSVSDVYSQELLKRLTQSLQTSGVDVSHANISVQLDVGKQVHSGSNAIAPSVGDVDNQTPNNQPISHAVEVSAKESIQAAKRLKTGES
ncbi:transcription factor BIM2-like isoform X2 [Amaranthus tricolor]|uniref:transcription factor BIM2-like isoform X2 n=1 Tax=Amaranthus tricolor TaxID=29722 RepID=UPI00258446EF|nr:transcription factor BIM2-like isoform X2 [Amaranthus tricolor]